MENSNTGGSFIFLTFYVPLFLYTFDFLKKDQLVEYFYTGHDYCFIH